MHNGEGSGCSRRKESQRTAPPSVCAVAPTPYEFFRTCKCLSLASGTALYQCGTAQTASPGGPSEHAASVRALLTIDAIHRQRACSLHNVYCRVRARSRRTFALAGTVPSGTHGAWSTAACCYSYMLQVRCSCIHTCTTAVLVAVEFVLLAVCCPFSREPCTPMALWTGSIASALLHQTRPAQRSYRYHLTVLLL